MKNSTFFDTQFFSPVIAFKRCLHPFSGLLLLKRTACCSGDNLRVHSGLCDSYLAIEIEKKPLFKKQ